jgi:hypothetical protein
MGGAASGAARLRLMAALVPLLLLACGGASSAIDTGSPKTVVDAAPASRLGLPDQGSVPGGITGVGSTAPAIRTHLSRWSIGTHRLAPDSAVVIGLPGGP